MMRAGCVILRETRGATAQDVPIALGVPSEGWGA